MNNTPRLWSTMTHLAALAAYVFPFGNIIGPLAVWLAKRAQFPEINESAKEALNFQITATLAAAVVCFFGYLITVLTAGLGAPVAWVLLGGVVMAHLVLTIAGIIAVNGGAEYRYPYSIRFIR